SPQMTDSFCSAPEYGAWVAAVVTALLVVAAVAGVALAGWPLAAHSAWRVLASPVQPPTPMAGAGATMDRLASVRATMLLSLTGACPGAVTTGVFPARS